MLLVAVGILAPLFWSLYRAKIPLQETDEGWIETRRSPFDHLIGIIQFFFGVIWIPVGSVMLFASEPALSGNAIVIGALMVVMGFLFIYSFYFSYLARIRFDSARIEYQALYRKISVSWNNVSKIKMGLNGPAVHTSDGSFSISNTRRGFFQLLEMARNQGVEIQDSPYLKPPSSSVDAKPKFD